jgi:BatD DUF11 like domain
MKRLIHRCLLIVIIAGLTAFASTAIADDPLIYATIEPAQITLGDSAKLTITNLGKGTEPIKLPTVSGLQFQVLGHTQQFEIVNGTTLYSTAIIVRVIPQMAGIFTIPPVTPRGQPLVLQVNSEHATANASKPGNAAPQVKPPIFSGSSLPSGVHLSEDGSAFLRLIVPKHEVYVGESVPIEIEIGMRSGFVSSLNGLPKLTGDNFTLNNLSRQPERTEKVIDGERFVVMNWHSLLTVVKPGTFSLAAEAPLTVRIRTRPRRDSLLDDQFGDPFLQNFFGATVPKDINVTSPAMEMTGLALPVDGRPPEFNGAVGSFKIAAEVTPDSAVAGDPLTLRMRVSGSGNFDRVDSPMLDHVDQWKTYPPKSSLNLADALGYKGEKIFEQPLIAAKPGKQTLPGLSFSYFDPSSRRYETAHSPPLSVTIAASLADSNQAGPRDAAVAATQANEAQSGLRPDHAASQALVKTLLPLYLQPRFLAIPSLLALAFAGGCWAVSRRKNSNDKSRAGNGLVSKSINRLLAQMDAAARSGDTSSFFGAARGALQEALAARWQVAPEQITAAEVGSKLERNGELIRRLFSLADEAQYAGHELSGTDFERWAKVVRHQLGVVTAA